MIISPSAITPYKIPTFQSGGGVPSFSFGNALEFDGVNDYVSFAPINNGDADFSLSFWFKPNEVITGSTIAFMRPGTNPSYFIGTFNNTKLRYNVGTATNFTVPAMAVGNWYHVVFTYDSGVGMRAYFNGIESVTGLSAGAKLFLFDEIGRYYTGAIIGEKTMDEIAIWDTTLTPTQITDLYNSGNGDYATNYSPANLVAYWRMNGVSNDGTAVDEKGTYNGTLNNFDTATCWVAH